jgi:threonylcarbamoyladenosine tRNA methylthiotransferase MtaB
MRVRLETLGCRLNTAELEHIARQLLAAGHSIVGPGETADVCILNTCAVTHVAARKSRQSIRQLRQALPDARLVATGCYATLEADQVRALGVDLVLDNRAKDHLAEQITWQQTGRLPGAPPKWVGLTPGSVPDGRLVDQMIENPPDLPVVEGDGRYPGAHTRAFLKVQDGCDNACTYCVVRIARGPGRSRPPDQVVDEVRRLAAMGYQEVVLSGVHLGSYGHDYGDRRGLFGLVRRVLNETEIPRVHLSSLEPWDLTLDFFGLWEDRRLGRHVHLPLQSGCDATLRRMGRRTTAKGFAELVVAGRAAIPDLSVTTDVMVGFPAESEAEFADSLVFVESMAFAKLHIFRYSPRAGTPAVRLPGRIPSAVAIERSQRMQAVGAHQEQFFRGGFVGRTLEVLWETAHLRENGLLWSGLTDNYLRVFAPGGATLRNVITPVYLTADTADGLRGEIVAAPLEGYSRSMLAPGATTSR